MQAPRERRGGITPNEASRPRRTAATPNAARLEARFQTAVVPTPIDTRIHVRAMLDGFMPC